MRLSYSRREIFANVIYYIKQIIERSNSMQKKHVKTILTTILYIYEYVNVHKHYEKSMQEQYSDDNIPRNTLRIIVL